MLGGHEYFSDVRRAGIPVAQGRQVPHPHHGRATRDRTENSAVEVKAQFVSLLVLVRLHGRKVAVPSLSWRQSIRTNQPRTLFLMSMFRTRERLLIQRAMSGAIVRVIANELRQHH